MSSRRAYWLASIYWTLVFSGVAGFILTLCYGGKHL